MPEASHQAVQKARDAAQALEIARETQIHKAAELAAEKASRRTTDDLIFSLKEVFGDSDSSSSGEMKILVRRIPILCVNIEQMHNDIRALKDSQTWAVRIVVGLFIAAVAKMIFLP